MPGFFMGRVCFFDIQIDIKIRLVDRPQTPNTRANQYRKI